MYRIWSSTTSLIRNSGNSNAVQKRRDHGQAERNAERVFFADLGGINEELFDLCALTGEGMEDLRQAARLLLALHRVRSEEYAKLVNRELRFRKVNQARDLALKPLCQIVDERFPVDRLRMAKADFSPS